MKYTLLLLSLLCAAESALQAGACGTLASPTSCVLDVNGQVRYTFSNFVFVNNFANGALPITAADVQVAAVAGSGLSGILQFTKAVTDANPNVAFVANPTSSAGFSFVYDIAVTPLTPGTVLFIDPATNRIDQTSFTQNGLSTVQWVMTGAPTCLAFTGSTSVDCTLPAGTTDTLTSGILVGLSGNNGNTSIVKFSNVYNTSFTEDPSGIPEPSTYILVGLGLAAVYRMRRR